MDILSYLAELIQTNKEVGLPELGTIFKKKSPGRYDAELHSFLPPSSSLNFKPEVTEDTLLSDYISKENNISLESAHYYRDQFTENLKTQLQEKQEADLDTLGKLILSNDVITLQANPDLNLDFEFYGLPMVEEEKSLVSPLPAEEQQEIQEQHQEPEEGQKPEAIEEPAVHEELEKPDPLEEVVRENTLEEENPGILPDEPIYLHPIDVQEEPLPYKHEPEPLAAVNNRTVEIPPVKPPFYKEPDYTEEPKKGTPVYLKIILGVLVLAILAMILFLVKPELFDQLTRNSETTSKPLVPLQKVADSTNRKTDSAKMDSVKKDTLVTPVKTKAPIAVKDTVAKKVAVPPALSTPAVLPEGTTYEIIGSSPNKEKEAQDFIASMKTKWGIEAKIVSHRKGKKIKISIASFKDKATADSERERLEKKIKIPKLYIYTDTHKPE